MDREIPKEVRNKERNKKIIRYGAIGVAGTRSGQCTHFIDAYGSEGERPRFLQSRQGYD